MHVNSKCACVGICNPMDEGFFMYGVLSTVYFRSIPIALVLSIPSPLKHQNIWFFFSEATFWNAGVPTKPAVQSHYKVVHSTKKMLFQCYTSYCIINWRLCFNGARSWIYKRKSGISFWLSRLFFDSRGICLSNEHYSIIRCVPFVLDFYPCRYYTSLENTQHCIQICECLRFRSCALVYEELHVEFLTGIKSQPGRQRHQRGVKGRPGHCIVRFFREAN